MKVGWNYFWRFGLGAVLGAGGAALLGVGITLSHTGLIVGGIAAIAVLGIYIITVIMPWTRRWVSDL
jgi:hypothetical protein